MTVHQHPAGRKRGTKGPGSRPQPRRRAAGEGTESGGGGRLRERAAAPGAAAGRPWSKAAGDGHCAPPLASSASRPPPPPPPPPPRWKAQKGEGGVKEHKMETYTPSPNTHALRRRKGGVAPSCSSPRGGRGGGFATQVMAAGAVRVRGGGWLRERLGARREGVPAPAVSGGGSVARASWGERLLRPSACPGWQTTRGRLTAGELRSTPGALLWAVKAVPGFSCARNESVGKNLTSCVGAPLVSALQHYR